ncbi:MAG TPA: CoA transferase, partial [Acidiphilium sp.]
PVIAGVFARLTEAELAARCERLGLPFAPIARPADLFADRHLRESGGLVPVTLPDGRQTELPGLPISMGGERPASHRNPPAPGADSRDVLAELGYSGPEIEAMIARGVAGAST